MMLLLEDGDDVRVEMILVSVEDVFESEFESFFVDACVEVFDVNGCVLDCEVVTKCCVVEIGNR